ncbi:TraR/DksA family transcriptional regulator [Roseibacillus persicicus]|uniref:Zinc finger DksA/TraR C4-type domain-containing protein n=1 Tax=Roseibacillus persicicus TaxID=454148 RepID=A0A918TMW5_9BACT|nr:TraR/DksA family transcriptional regulator [Roseibacillus persicicus]GHC53161.1 hypothetical protein GCM10007100_19520 [Roseibacillus persicicus]
MFIVILPSSPSSQAIDLVVLQEKMLAELSQAKGSDHTALQAKTNAALKRMREGGYGLCESCGSQIPLPRLMARPVVSNCLACQEVLEKKQIESPFYSEGRFFISTQRMA